jgi:hypothetical protein
MSAAAIDRRLAGERAKYQLRGRVGTKPGSLLKNQIPVHTWAEWDDAVPGFVEVDLVWHDGGNRAGGHAFTLTLTDIATGWTENRSVPDKTAKCVLAAFNDIARTMPFPILRVDCDNGSEFINDLLLQWCQGRQITFTRARPGNKNDGCHVEQKNWTVIRTLVGYHRYDTAAELLLLNEIWQLQSKLTTTSTRSRNWSPRSAQEPRCPRNTIRRPPRSSRDRSPHHDRATHRGADPDLRPDQSGRHPAPGPSPDRSAPRNGHQQSRTGPTAPINKRARLRHDYVRQRIRLPAHLDMKQQASNPPERLADHCCKRRRAQSDAASKPAASAAPTSDNRCRTAQNCGLCPCAWSSNTPCAPKSRPPEPSSGSQRLAGRPELIG